MKTALRAIIIDDEVHSINSLKWEAEALSDVLEIVASTTSPFEALDWIMANTFDILFLDVEMPGMNGFELLERLHRIDFDIVFTTAYDEFAVKAFQVDATDYLLKPVSEEALRKCVEKIMHRRETQTSRVHLSRLLSRLALEIPGFKKVALPTLNGLLFVKPDDVTHCSSDSNYTHVFTSHGERILISRPLKDVEELFAGPAFIRVHHSHLVNIAFVREYHRGKGGSLVLEDGTVIPVSRNRKQNLIERF